jgi:hypothetical protein
MGSRAPRLCIFTNGGFTKRRTPFLHCRDSEFASPFCHFVFFFSRVAQDLFSPWDHLWWISARWNRPKYCPKGALVELGILRR